MKMFEPNQIANWYLARVDRAGGNAITHLKLQNLVFYTQAWSLGLYGEPIFEEDVLAPPHGVSIESVRQRFAEVKLECLPAPESTLAELDIDKEASSLLDDIFESYGRLEATQLKELIVTETPWVVARSDLDEEDASAPIISKESLKRYYGARYAEAKRKGEVR